MANPFIVALIVALFVLALSSALGLLIGCAANHIKARERRRP